MTPKQCKETAGSFADLPKEFQLSASELEMIQEEVEAKHDQRRVVQRKDGPRNEKQMRERDDSRDGTAGR